MQQKYYFFYNGIFSNWYPCEFMVEHIKYNCGEQYMMFQKAIIFKDIETATKILASKSPKEQKELGRSVTNFNYEIWDEIKFSVVKEGIREKFKQNPELKKVLLEYRGCKFVEASPNDRIWGIGFSEKDALNNIANWGENILGKILTDLSFELSE